MKNKKIKILIIVSIIIILLLTGYFKFQKSNNLENFLIFNLYENSSEKSLPTPYLNLSSTKKTPENKYFFDITSAGKQKINVNLNDTVLVSAAAKEKLAPGTKGEFEIALNSSKKLRYQIRFDSKNKKPKNVKFNIKDEVQNKEKLEDLEDNLRGELKPNEAKKIIIEWTWEYEIDAKSNIQDTLDGKTIRAYNFDINVLSYEV